MTLYRVNTESSLTQTKAKHHLLGSMDKQQIGNTNLVMVHLDIQA